MAALGMASDRHGNQGNRAGHGARGTFLRLGLALLCLCAAGASLAQKMKMPKSEYGASAVFAGDGTLYAVAKQGEHVMLYRSADAGAHWSAPVAVNAVAEAVSADGENRPKIVATADALIVTWTRPLSKPYSGEIRLARSNDGGVSFSAPLTVHGDRSEITHRFETPLVAGDGRLYVAWIDKRDLEAANAAQTLSHAPSASPLAPSLAPSLASPRAPSPVPYRGAAIYAAVSDDGGRSFRPETKVADHSCECCRIAAAVDSDGAPLILWRHVFAPNERDHALAKLNADGRAPAVTRATFDRWRVDGCPHHGPSLAVAPDGTRHAVWFNQQDSAGRVFYGRLMDGRVDGQRPIGGERAAHADIAVAARRVAIAWKEFDGEKTRLRAEVSNDGGRHFAPIELAQATAASDQPRLLVRGADMFVFWRTQTEGMRVFKLP